MDSPARAAAARRASWAGRLLQGVAACALATFTGLAPAPAAAQTADSNSLLLRPSLDGNPTVPPRFKPAGRRPAGATHKASPSAGSSSNAPEGAIPDYGAPLNFGMGSTGFDSMNTPPRKRRARTKPGAVPHFNATFEPVPTFSPPAPPPPAPPLPIVPPEIYPNKAAARAGAALPPPPVEPPISNPPAEVYPVSAALRRGAVLPMPPPEDFDYSANLPPPTLPSINKFSLGMLPQQPLAVAASDPYAALGIRAGSFLLLPSLDLSTGYSTNPQHLSGAPASPFVVAAPELQVNSDWERHSLTADIKGSYTDYTEDMIPSLNVPFLNSKIDGTIDVLRGTQIVVENRAIISSDNPGSPNLQTQIARLPLNQDVGGTLGVIQQFNRLSLSFNGTFDRATFDNSQLTNGQTASNADRNFDQYAGIIRGGYDLGGGVSPFIQVEADERIHDLQFDRNGLQRDSVGTSISAGGKVDLFGSLTGEMAIGYIDRAYRDPTLPNVSGPIANGTLLWQVSALTAVKLVATSQVYETVVDGASGEFSRDVYAQVDHAFRAWLVGTLKAGYGTDNYVGSGLNDTRYFASAGITYKFNREVQVHTELRQDWQTASQPGFSYTATSVLLGLRLQR
jgi:hypothetical protein